MDLPFDSMVGKPVSEAARVSDGINNPTYRVVCRDGSRYVVQLAGSKFPEKVRRQRSVVALLQRETDLPVAGVVKADTSRQVVDNDYIVREHLPGRVLKDAVGSFDDGQVARLFGDMARCLGSLHGVAFGSFGELVFRDDGIGVSPSFPSAREQLHAEYKGWVEKAVGTPFEGFIPRLKGWLDANIGVFGPGIGPCLTHNDFSSANILVSEAGAVTGVVDLDNIRVGGNVVDIYRVYHAIPEGKRDVALDAFFSTYPHRLPEGFDRQMRFFEATHVLAYIDCWEQIVASYTPEALDAMVGSMKEDIEALLSVTL